MVQPSWKLRYLNDKDVIIYPLVEKVQYPHVHKTRCSRIEESYLRRFRSSSFLNTYTPIEAIYGFFAASSFDNPKTEVSTSFITIKQKISLSSREWWVLTRLKYEWMHPCCAVSQVTHHLKVWHEKSTKDAYLGQVTRKIKRMGWVEVTIAFKSSPFGFSLNEITLPLLSIFIKPKSEARLTTKWKEKTQFGNISKLKDVAWRYSKFDHPKNIKGYNSLTNQMKNL